ncbi:hypothetical protein [Candidatus Babela massiliensis]|uniref:Uncharacterized protein n=1 Tax=Candidatus Babela massiliensis TaxID=673862 RepID=V6DHQ5_9BACT|nr:hypothetical protein [Candidatus Babela massiliensis]CDK31085.1 hypothetical protein BABL1_gene_800 [Candidatus Babela massiliensis]
MKILNFKKVSTVLLLINFTINSMESPESNEKDVLKKTAEVNISSNEDKSSITNIINELIERLYPNSKNYLNFDLFYNLDPQRQNIIVDKLINYEAGLTDNETIKLNRQLLRHIVKLSKNYDFNSQLYNKLYKINKNLPKDHIITQSIIESFLTNLEDTVPNFFEEDIIEFTTYILQITNDIVNSKLKNPKEKSPKEKRVEKRIIDKIREFINPQEEKSSIEASLDEKFNIIKNLILAYHSKFGTIFINKAFKGIDKEIFQKRNLAKIDQIFFRGILNEAKKIIPQN